MLEIKTLREQDEQKVIDFTLNGLHIDKYYTDVPEPSKRSRAAAANYWRKLKCEATRVLAAYEGDELRGVLLAEMKGEPKAMYSLLDDLKQRWFYFYVQTFLHEDWKTDDDVDEQLFERFRKEYDPDGHILLLLADPAILKKGIGRFLITEFEKQYPGKLVYLYTDSDCSWPFYDRLGYIRYAEQEAVYDEEGSPGILKMLYYRNYPERA